MKDISSMSRAELVRALIASSPTTAEETGAAYTENRGSRRSGTRDALVSRKIAVARELLLRDLAERMKAEPVLSAPNTVRDWLQLYCAHLEHGGIHRSAARLM
jgi:DNA repair protein RadC